MRPTLLVLPVASVLAVACAAQGQNVLDANLYAPGGTNPIVQQQDFRSRNLLVTDSVPGGRGFRGTVGYTSENDFRASTGSDDLYLFRAGSAWSDVNLVNYGNTYNRLRFGQNIGLVEFSFNRDYTGSTVNRLPSASEVGLTAQGRLAHAIQLDEISFSSSIAAASLLASESVNVGEIRDQEGNVSYITASPITGLATVEPERDMKSIGLTSWDVARLKDDFDKGLLTDAPGTRFQLRFVERLKAAQAPGTRPGAGARDLKVPGLDAPDYRAILESIASRYSGSNDVAAGTDPTKLAQLDDDLEALRRRIAGGRAGENPTADLPVEPRPDDPAALRVNPTIDIGTILQHGQRVESLTSDDPSRFNGLVRKGEEHLKKGEYFRAETDFKRALRFTPGHPLATAGLVHAQIGGGLYLPASATLRSLYMFQPEMIDVEYAPELVPNRSRLNRAVEEVQAGFSDERSRTEYALLLTYLGHLLDDEALMREGLIIWRGANADDELAPLVESIWLPTSESPEGQVP